MFFCNKEEIILSNNIVKAGFYGGRFATTRSLYQYDYGIKLKIEGLELPTVFETHFSNGEFDETTTALGRNGVVVIPDIYLTTGKMVYAFIYLHTESDDGETVYRINIPVKKRGKPIDQEATPQEQSTITQAIAELNNAINVSNSNAEYAEGYMNQAHGYSTDAYNYANTASEQAILAGQSAQTAEQMKNDAIGAATRASASATRAEDNAVIAVNSANAAAQSAEDAQSSAESAVASATDAAASAQSAHSSAQSIQSMTVEATTLTPGSPATAAWNNGTLSLGIPAGSKGDPGEGITYHVCSSGEYNASTGEPTIQSPQENIIYLVPSQDSDNPNLFTEWIYVNSAWEMFGAPSIDLSNYLTDVLVNGTSVVGSDGVASIPMAGSSTLGVVKVNSSNGISITNSGLLQPTSPTDNTIKAGSDGFRPITSNYQHKATFYGLAKAAGDSTQSQSDNPVGTYTDDAKTAIKSMLGVEDPDVTDVQVNGTSVVQNGVANVPYADASTPGVFKVGSGLYMQSGDYAGTLAIYKAGENDIKVATNGYKPIVPERQHMATFYGLAKAAGDTTQSASNNAVGTYTDEAKASIQTMLGVPSADEVVKDVTVNGTSVVDAQGNAEIPKADTNTFGVIRVGNGLFVFQDKLNTDYATDANIKGGSSYYKPITPIYQHRAAFYGLAKAAGADEASSTLPMGTYTDTAKVAIRNMIGATGESATITVTGTDPVITAQSNARYICGEVLSLTFTPPATGICEVIFTSGSSVTVLDLPQTVMMPEWFEVETNKTYDISIVDGVYGAVMSW